MDVKEPENDTNDYLCSQCLQNSKNIKFYMRTVENLKKRIKTNKILKTKIVRLQKSKKNIENSGISLPASIDKLEIILFNKSGKIYSEAEKLLCQWIYFRSSSGYAFLRETLGFSLPCTSSLHNWIQIKKLLTGCLTEIKRQVDKLKPVEKELILIFDEMSIQENLTYNQVKDQVDGFVDYGEYERNNVNARSVCVFMVRSLCGRFKQILYYVATPGSIPSEILNAEVKKSLDICEHLELKVNGIVCDQGPTNRKFYTLQNISCDKPYFLHNNKKIFAMHDVPHLLKNMRNNDMKYNMQTEDGIASWDVIKFLYDFEKSQVHTKVCPKRILAHIEPKNFQKMSVCLATRVLSHSVAKGIRALLALNKYPDNLKEVALSTANFIEKINTLFDYLNGRPPIKQLSNEIKYVENMQSYILNIKCVSKDLTNRRKWNRHFA